MKKKINIIAIASIACGFLVTSCVNNNGEDTKDVYKLTVEQDAGVSSVKVFSGETEVTDLTRVEEDTALTAKIVVLDDYELTAVTLDGTALPVTGGSYAFTMPSKDATLKVTTSKVLQSYALTVNKDEGVESVQVFNGETEVTDLTKIQEGTALSAKVTLKENYTISSVTLGSNTLTGTDGTYSFTMPSSAATLTVSTEALYDSSVKVTNDDTKGTYTLTINGEVSTTGKCNAGDTIKVVVTPNTHYRVKSLTINGTDTEYTDGGYEFTATEGTTTVTINYEGANAFNLKALDTSFSSVTAYKGDTKLYNGDYVFEGEEVTIKINGYSLGSSLNQIFIYVNDTFVRGDDEKVTFDSSKNELTYKFVAGNTATNVYVLKNGTISESETAVSIDFEDNEYLKVYGFEGDDKYSFNYSSIYFTKDAGYTLKSVEITYTDETTETLSVTDESKIYYIDNIDSGALMLYTPITQDATIKFIGETEETFAIEYVGLDKITIDGGTSSFLSKAAPGTVITVANLATRTSQFRIDNVLIESNGEALADASFNPGGSYSKPSYSFTMPSAPVTITFDVKENGKIKVNADENITNVSIRDNNYSSYNEIESAKPGTNFYVFFETAEGYGVSTVVDDDGKEYSVTTTQQYDSSSSQYYTVSYILATMPTDGSDIELTLTSALLYEVSITSTSDYTISLNSRATEFAVGAEVSFTAKPSSKLYVLTGVYLTDTNGEALDVEIETTTTELGYINGTFKMPNQDVKIGATTTKADVLNLSVSVDNEITGVATSDLFSSFSITNYDSNVHINTYSDNLSAEFLPGSNTNASFTLSGDSYGASVAYTLKDGTMQEFAIGNISVSSSGRMYSFPATSVPETATGIVVKVFEIEPVSATIRDKTGDNLTDADYEFKLNNETVTTLTDCVFEGSKLNVKVTKEAPEGFAYVVTYYSVDSEGNETELTPNYSGDVSISGDFVVEITKVECSTVTFENNTTYNLALTLYSSDYSYTNYDCEPIYGTQNAIVSIMMNSYLSSSVDLQIKITIGGEVVVDEVWTASSYSEFKTDGELTIDGNIVITVTPVE